MRYYFRPGHPRADDYGFVSGDDLSEIPMEPPKALNAGIMSGRFYEGTTTLHCDEKGKVHTVDLGSRAKHREYMKEHGLAPGTDYSAEWYQQKRAAEDRATDKLRRDAVARAFYEISEGKKAR